jgi:hypothetical protein
LKNPHRIPPDQTVTHPVQTPIHHTTTIFKALPNHNPPRHIPTVPHPKDHIMPHHIASRLEFDNSPDTNRLFFRFLGLLLLFDFPNQSRA